MMRELWNGSTRITRALRGKFSSIHIARDVVGKFGFQSMLTLSRHPLIAGACQLDENAEDIVCKYPRDGQNQKESRLGLEGHFTIKDCGGLAYQFAG
jgi:hypothetical protein